MVMSISQEGHTCLTQCDSTHSQQQEVSIASDALTYVLATSTNPRCFYLPLADWSSRLNNISPTKHKQVKVWGEIDTPSNQSSFCSRTPF